MRRFVALATPLLVIAPLAVAQSSDADQPAAATEPAPAAESTPAEPQPASQVTQVPAPKPVAAPAPAQPQEKWTKKIYPWASVGTTFAYGNTYGSVTAGVAYLRKHGLAPNVELSYNFGADPTLWTLRPGITWFMPVPRLNPYIGAYYTRWFVGSGLPDQNGVGGRAGVSVGKFLSLSVTYDRALNCDRNCDIWTPQVGAGFSL